MAGHQLGEFWIDGPRRRERGFLGFGSTVQRSSVALTSSPTTAVVPRIIGFTVFAPSALRLYRVNCPLDAMPGIIVGRPTLKYSILCQTVWLGAQANLSTNTTVDLTGQRFGRLIVLQRAEKGKRGKTRWVC